MDKVVSTCQKEDYQTSGWLLRYNVANMMKKNVHFSTEYLEGDSSPEGEGHRCDILFSTLTCKSFYFLSTKVGVYFCNLEKILELVGFLS